MPLSLCTRTGKHNFTRGLFIGLTFGMGVTDRIARHRGCTSRPSETRKKNKNARDGDAIGFSVFQGSGNLLSLEQTGLQLYRFLRYNRNQCCHSRFKVINGSAIRGVGTRNTGIASGYTLKRRAFLVSRVSKISDKKSANRTYAILTAARSVR